QLLVMVALLLGLALVPLFWTATTMARWSLERTEQQSAQALSRALAASLAQGNARWSVADTGDARLSVMGPIVATVLMRPDGKTVFQGRAVPVALLPLGSRSELVERRDGSRVIWSGARGNAGFALVGVTVVSSPLQLRSMIGLLALYIGMFGVGLLLAIHVAVTWLIVRPLDALGRAARRVAFGNQKLELPRLPARELQLLGQSFHTMTEKLLADERELRQRLDEIHLTHERLEQAQERLIRSERLASVGRLAAGLAHEVGNPIAAMMGLEELLLEGGLSHEEQVDFLRRIHSETERIHRILRDLLDFARPTQTGQAEVDGEPGDVVQGVAETLALCQPQKAFKQVKIETALPADLPLVALSRPKLVQVLLNLLLNAADALAPCDTTGERVGAREAFAAGARIVITGEPRSGGVVLTIADNGPGVVESVQQHLFEPFISTKEIGKGTGLGLAVCRGLVESIGGTIRLDNAHSGGACFVIELPRYQE
ncbi:MAG TPA: HAMP domain-containing sensor histidine kinase, partial [Polyangiaceae bacterium]